MEVPLKIVLKDISPYEDVIEAEVRDLAAKLGKYFPGIISCRVTVEKPHKHHHTGSLYRATVLLTVPGKQISVNREHPLHKSHEDIFVAVRHAFDDAARQMEEFSLVWHKDVKGHDTLPHGVVAKLFPDGYGFIVSFGGREIYFHKNSVLDGFEKLKIGTEVRFHEEEGEKGPQASTVKIVRKAHLHHRRH
ncbi:MAG TPA: 30S ribosomal protein S30 [Nitrospiraceae bacterium]|nr:30S ribosomal protein S30 [Nitrospiraceae bacterium]